MTHRPKQQAAAAQGSWRSTVILLLVAAITREASAHVEEAAIHCSICRHTVAPTILRAIEASTSAEDAERLTEEALRPLARTHAFDAVSRTTSMRERPKLESASEETELDEHIHHFVESLLFDIHQSSTVYGFFHTYHHFPKRRKYMSRLIEHMLCLCDQELGLGDDHVRALIQDFQAAMNEVRAKYGHGHDAENIDRIVDQVDGTRVMANSVPPEGVRPLPADGSDPSEEEARRRRGAEPPMDMAGMDGLPPDGGGGDL